MDPMPSPAWFSLLIIAGWPSVCSGGGGFVGVGVSWDVVADDTTVSVARDSVVISVVLALIPFSASCTIRKPLLLSSGSSLLNLGSLPFCSGVNHRTNLGVRRSTSRGIPSIVHRWSGLRLLRSMPSVVRLSEVGISWVCSWIALSLQASATVRESQRETCA